MPILMPIYSFLAWFIYADNANKLNELGIVQFIAAIVTSLGILTTLIFNVPIDKATGRFNVDLASPEWIKLRNTWTFYHRFPSIIFMVAFILQVISLKMY